VGLEDDFENECWIAVAKCKALGYPPNIWISMMRNMGAVNAARQLLISGDVQEGFHRLVRMGRIDLTIEFAALNSKWDSLFDVRHREAAWWRLEQAMNSSS
jgi:hypothetical protein